MAKFKIDKPISERLNQRHKWAISQALDGNYLNLIKVLLETDKAIHNVSLVESCGAIEWKANTLKYYEDLRNYLLTFIVDDAEMRLYIRHSQHETERRINEK